MKIIKYKKGKNNEYKILTDEKEYNLYDDIIIRYELLLKKEISKKEWEKILKENNLQKAYYEGLKAINTKLRTAKEIGTILKKKDYTTKEIEYAINRLESEGYLNHKIYIESFIHDALTLKVIGEHKIYQDLIKLGFKEEEIKELLNKVDPKIYQEKIAKYVTKKLKANKKSVNEFKQKITIDLIKKGFNKEDVIAYLDTIALKDNEEQIIKLINKLYNKYINKYDLYTTKMKIKEYLYRKGYNNIDIDTYLKRTRS